MIRERFDLGTGEVFVLSKAGDWRELSPGLRRIVPAPMREAWRSFPQSFVDRAHQLGEGSLQRWLLLCAKKPSHLRVYDTDDFGRAALLEVHGGECCLLDFRTPTTRTRRFPPSAPKSACPARIPASLTKVYDAVGGIQHQFGASGTLIPPDALEPLESYWPYDQPPVRLNPVPAEVASSLVAEIMRTMRAKLEEMGEDVSMMTDALVEEAAQTGASTAAKAMAKPGFGAFPMEQWLAECPGAPSRDQVADMFPFYEDSGDYLCFDPEGRATWIGWETGGVMPFGTVETALDAYFASLIAAKPFKHAFEPLG